MSPFNKRWLNIVSLSLMGILMLSGLSFSQSCTPTISQPVCMTETHAELDQLTIGDLDFENFGSSHWFFTLNINSIAPMEVKLHVTVDIVLSSETFTDAVRLTTQPFSVPRTITNLDIGKNGAIKTESFEFSNEAKDRIKDIALATGKLPSGTYTFNVNVEDVSGTMTYDTRQIILTLQNFSRIELLNPLNSSETPSAFPLFQWLYDGNNVELAVYEKLSHHQSNEEALTGTPHLLVRSGDPGLPEGVRTYLYPSSGARALEQGKTYVWSIRALTTGTGGSDAGLSSEVWQFTVSTGTGGAGASFGDQFVTTEELANQLTDIPGIDVEALKKLLEDYQMTGVVYINGQRISLTELKLLLEELLANPDRIIEMKVID